MQQFHLVTAWKAVREKPSSKAEINPYILMPLLITITEIKVESSKTFSRSLMKELN